MGCVVVGTINICANEDHEPVDVDIKRNLTAGEIALAKLMFKDAIDYSKVKIVRGGLKGMPDRTDNAMTPKGEIHLPTKEYDTTKDFSKSLPRDKVWFMHEMTHVWQYQLGFDVVTHGAIAFAEGGYVTRKGEDRPIAYMIYLEGKDRNKSFKEFSFEQQGDIVSFYFDAVYLKNSNIKRHSKNIKDLPLFREILKDFLINPKNQDLLPVRNHSNYK
ncbi:zinc protease [Acinetobacter sp. MB5]|uniref:zinc protease n=1 Tax=Acinetobacter sp. MB5 TaxID=2069438 RepID=UPI000DD08F18|nr:zinc protease [Acinetobacter sp. MB5]